MKEIPIYPCSTCSNIEQTVCMSCRQAVDYKAGIQNIATKYGSLASIYADKMARIRGNIAKAERDLAYYAEQYEQAKKEGTK